MNLIERYIYAVTRYLPKELQVDVAEELRANIEEMLPENASEKEVKVVLEQLGAPDKLANAYSPSKRYLIGPKIYDQYLSILKLVCTIVAPVFIGLAVLNWSIDPTGIDQLINDIVTSIVEGLLQSAIWVTVVFATIERKSLLQEQVDWLNHLPKRPERQKPNISRAEILFEMIFNTICLAILWFFPGIIGFAAYSEELGLISVFNPDIFTTVLPQLTAIIGLGLAINLWQWLSPRWTKRMALVNTACNVAAFIMGVYMIHQPNLINPQVVEAISAYVPINLLGTTMTTLAAATLAIGVLIDSGIGLWKAFKGR